ncbi:MAG: DUF4384 domain-containing protein, partial [Rhodospirillales bacterium]|nr:DUF4384 domain-containing protein [Rhodospirillales bacterium]
AAKRGGAPMAAILGGAVLVLALAGGGAWWFLRPAPVPSGGTGANGALVLPAPPPVTPTPSPKPAPKPKPAPVPAPQPAPVPAPQPAPAPAPSPAPAPAPHPSMAELTQRMQAAISATDCTLAAPRAGAGDAIAVGGYAGTGVADVLRARLAAIAGGAALEWRVMGVQPVFCDVLAAIRPAAPAAGAPDAGLALRLAGGQTALHDGARIEPRVTMPGFSGYLRVDYLGHDGSVVHLYPTVADPAQHFLAVPARQLAAGAVLRLGDGTPGQPLWEVGPPYGTDMILAVASSRPLALHPVPPNIEDHAAGYLAALKSAIAAAQAAGEPVSATLLPVDTLAPGR